MKNPASLLFSLLFLTFAAHLPAQWVAGELGSGVIPSGANAYKHVKGEKVYLVKVQYQGEIRFAELSARSFYIDARIGNDLVRIPAGTPIEYYTKPFVWVPVSKGALPDNALVAGAIGERNFYVIRGNRNGNLCLGRTERPARINGTVLWDGNDYPVSTYEVLVFN